MNFFSVKIELKYSPPFISIIFSLLSNIFEGDFGIIFGISFLLYELSPSCPEL
jgi:hypothetical protein